jgi:hypothetical protein
MIRYRAVMTRSKDLRRPVDVTRDFRERLARELVDRGFVARRQNSRFVRRHGDVTESVELSSSFHNTRGHVTSWGGLFVVDKALPGWRAGGDFGSPAFKQDRDWNIADTKNADDVLEHIVDSLGFFALTADPDKLLARVCTRYVGGFVDPSVVVPYLAARRGDEAVATYARALLDGRGELWPGFLGQRDGSIVASKARPGHGAELALMLATHAPGVAITPPTDAVRARDHAPANLRGNIGLQLRAWGEPAAAPLLRRMEDERVLALNEAQRAVGMTVDDPVSARMALREVTGEDRALRRRKPKPRLFQYEVLHDPFAPAWSR